MRIAVDATYSLGENLSGVGVYCRELLRAMSAARPESTLLHCFRPHRYFASYRVTLPRNARRKLLLDHHAPAADLFHGLNQRLPRVRYRRRVTTFHDLFVFTGEYSTPEFKQRFAAQARWAAENSDAIITVSGSTARIVESLLGVERSRLHVVHHGVRPLKIPPRQPQNVVLTVGAIQKRKNIARLVEAFEALEPVWSLVIAGSAGYGAEEILARIERSPARERIRVLGYLSDEDLGKWYSRADIFAFPSLDEGFGMPVLEAMSAGIPVLAAKRASLPEVCGDAALMVDGENQQELTQALLELSQNADLRERLAGNGRLRAPNFTWQNAAEQTWRVYSKLF